MELYWQAIGDCMVKSVLRWFGPVTLYIDVGMHEVVCFVLRFSLTSLFRVLLKFLFTSQSDFNNLILQVLVSILL